MHQIVRWIDGRVERQDGPTSETESSALLRRYVMGPRIFSGRDLDVFTCSSAFPSPFALSPRTDCRSAVGCCNQNQRVERVSNDVKEARSFFFDDEEDEEDLRDQEGDDDEVADEKEKVHIRDEDDEDDEEDYLPPPKKTTANAGSPGSGGSAATPAKSLCDGDSCSPLAEEWLNAWGKSSAAWAQVLQDIKGGKLAVVDDALKQTKAEAVQKAAAALGESAFTAKSSTEAFVQKRMQRIEASSPAYPKELKELSTLLEGAKMRELLTQASGVPLDGPVVIELVWRKAGDHARVNRTGEHVSVEGLIYRTRIGFRLEIPLDWDQEWGGETLWADPLFALAPQFNQLLFFPAGPAQAVQRVSTEDEVADKEKFGKGRHLVLQGWYTSSKVYDAKMLEMGYDILKSRVKGADVHLVGHLISGSSGAASPLKSGAAK